jgi:hypothetical protein
LRNESAALSALSAQSPSVFTRRKAAAAAQAPPAEPSITEPDSQSIDLDDIGPPFPPRIPAFRNCRNTFISCRDLENDDAPNQSDGKDDNSIMEGPPAKKSIPSQDDNQEGDSNPDGEIHNDNPIDSGNSLWQLWTQ